MIYLDNSATTYPKPKIVYNAINYGLKYYGANAGRGSYNMAIRTSEKIYETRKAVADFFNCKNVENVIFTYNCTTSLNMAIKGLAQKGAHFVISDLEHNAVVRPLEKLKSVGFCDYSVARVEKDDIDTIKNFSNAIRSNTVAVICSGASNVFGIIPPFKAIAQIAHDYGKLFILDAAQISGIIPIDFDNSCIDVLCCSGHKGLYGLSGTGVLLVKENVKLNTIIEGGTGSNSSSKTQPEVTPDKFESGTPNIQGIIALKSGIDFINSVGIDKIYKHENLVVSELRNYLRNNDKINVYCDSYNGWNNLAPVLSFNVNGLHSEKVARQLSGYNVAVRAGLHCSPLAHKKMNTLDSGTVRVSPSFFTKKNDIDFLIKCVRKIAK